MPSLSSQFGQLTVNTVLVVPFKGVIEQKPLPGARLIKKLIALELDPDGSVYVTSKRQYSIAGFDTNTSLVVVKLLEFEPRKTIGVPSFVVGSRTTDRRTRCSLSDSSVTRASIALADWASP